MENQSRHESGITNDYSCGCSRHPGSGAWDCSGSASMHGSSKMGSIDPFKMVIPMWHKGFFAAELMIEKLKKRIEAAYGPVMDKVADVLIWVNSSRL
ncbi:MAG: hypothetical protein WA667_10410 [Candidatus Nitrosopolaris sp.]